MIMRKIFSTLLALSFLFAANLPRACATLAESNPVGSKPNIIFILTDDLGYGDVGVLYQNGRPAGKPRIFTPHLDQLAADGLILKQHYTGSPVCAPARASLLLGQHQGDCDIRNNEFDKALPKNHTLATVLREAGYHTGAIGKWGLQGKEADTPGHPLYHGFDEFYGVLSHGQAHHHYPVNTGFVMDMFTPVTNGLDCAYDTDLYAARAKKFIEDQVRERPKQPFFLYLAFTAPHFFHELPTQAYPAGGGTNGGLQWPLNTNSGKTNSYYYPQYANQSWPDVEKRHASMIQRVDDAVGDIRQLLKDLNIADNTLVIFTSDNGPHNEDKQDPRFFDSWGEMDGIKRDLWEAGIREPTIISWPAHIAANTTSDVPSCFWDWLPTFADLGGVPAPAQADGVSIVPTLTGVGKQRSRGFYYWEYAFGRKNSGPQFPVDKEMFARKHVDGRFQLQGIRLGDYMAVRYQVTNSRVPFRLYNVVTDPHEDHDLAGDPAHAALLQKARDMVRQVRRPNEQAHRPYDRDLVPASEPGICTSGYLNYAMYLGQWPWVPDFDALAVHATGVAVGLDPDVSKQEGDYGISYKGYIKVPANGEYTFYLKDDSGAQLWLHEAHLIDDDFNHDGKEVSATILLQKGYHPIRLFYRHKSGPKELKLDYSGPEIERHAFPVSAFYGQVVEKDR
jgi:arylsulfatase A-like enzyme